MIRPKKPGRVVLYSQHLIGMGHHFRILQIADALANDYEVHFVDGGRHFADKASLSSIPIIRLEPVFEDVALKKLVPEDPTRNTEDVLAGRTKHLSNEIARIRPHVFLIEHFPFERWELSKELLSAIKTAKSVNRSVKVICSVRDIPSNQAGADEIQQLYILRSLLRWFKVLTLWNPSALKKLLRRIKRHRRRVIPTLNRYFDYLLVHGDPGVIQLEEHLQRTDEIRIPIIYTGYVSMKPNGLHRPTDVVRRNDDRDGIVLVSAGGGLDGFRMIQQCIIAWNRLIKSDRVGYRKMVIFSGPFLKSEEYDRLKLACADGPFVLKQFTPNFLDWMQAADFSISRAGYNTSMNVLETRTPALFVPSPCMSDQEPRARRLAEMGLVKVIADVDLTPERIASAILQGISLPPIEHKIALDGTERTCETISKILLETY